ncbi:ABC transporter substrate-binding protein, partial [Paraburkholderia sp. SIMBA_009]
PREYAQLWAKRAQLEPDVAYRWLGNAHQRVGPVDDAAAKDAQNTADFLHKAGVIPVAYDTTKLLDRSYAGAFAAPAQQTAAAR